MTTTAITPAKKAPVMFNPDNMTAAANALMTMVPGASNLTPEQAMGAVIAARASGRNLFTKEAHATTQGLFESGWTIIGEFTDWCVERKKDSPEWGTVRVVNDPTIREQLAVTPRDMVVFVEFWYASQRQSWREDFDRLKTMVEVGMITWAEVKAQIGLGPKPAASAYGVVRWDEQAKGKKDASGKYIPVPEAEVNRRWSEMDRSMSRERRAEKRAKAAIARMLFKPTQEMRERWALEARERGEAAQAEVDADHSKIINAHGEVISLQRTEMHDRQHAAMRAGIGDLKSDEPFGMAPVAKPIIADDGSHKPNAAQVIDNEPTGADVDDTYARGMAFQPTDEELAEVHEAMAPAFEELAENAQKTAVESEPQHPRDAADAYMPKELTAIKYAVETLAVRYAEADEAGDAKRKQMFMLLMPLVKGANKAATETNRRKLLEFLTGTASFNDVPGRYITAIRESWLRPFKRSKDEYPEPRDECKAEAAAICKLYRGAQPEELSFD